MCAAQMVALPPDTWLRLAVWMLAGGAVYVGYSRRHMLPVADRVARMLGEAAAGAGAPPPPNYSTVDGGGSGPRV